MEQELKQYESEGKYSMDQFRDEIAELAARAVKEHSDGNFFIQGTHEPNSHFDVSQLTEEDWDIWKKIKEGTITIEEFRSYADGVLSLDEHDGATESRVIFSKVASNRATVAIVRRVLPKKEK